MYSDRFKERVVQRLTGPDAISAKGLAREIGIAQPTLSRWLRQAKVGAMPKSKRPKKRRVTSRWSAEEKLRFITESAGLSDEELGAFLRREGLHELDLKQIRADALAGLAPPKRKARGLSPEHRRIAKLEKELHRKEKALAETAALLVLQGKVQAFLRSEAEEGDMNSDSED